MEEIMRDQMNKSLGKNLQKINKQWKIMSKISRSKSGNRINKKTQTVGNLEIKNLKTQAKTFKDKCTNRI